MTDTKMLQEIAQEMAEMQKAMEKSGDADPVWTSAEVARQNMADCWDAIAGAWDIEDIDTETRDRLWDMVVEAYFGPTTPTPEIETDTTTREQLVASLETEKDPIGAIIAYIRDEMSGLVRHDLDAKNNGWDPYRYPANGYIWHEAESILLEAAGVEDLDDLEGIYDDAYADLVDAIGTLLEGDEDMAIEALVEAWEAMVDDGEMGEIEMAQSLIEQAEGGCQGWDASVEDAEAHPDIALMIGLDPEAEPEDPDEMEDLWETWGRVVGEAARRWLARHPEARKAAYAEAGAVDPDGEEE